MPHLVYSSGLFPNHRARKVLWNQVNILSQANIRNGLRVSKYCVLAAGLQSLGGGDERRKPKVRAGQELRLFANRRKFYQGTQCGARYYKESKHATLFVSQSFPFSASEEVKVCSIVSSTQKELISVDKGRAVTLSNPVLLTE